MPLAATWIDLEIIIPARSKADGALGRPRGMGWRGRQEGGSGWGTHVNPWLTHVNVWQKPLQYCKVISFQLIKITEKKIKKKKAEKADFICCHLHMKSKNTDQLGNCLAVCWFGLPLLLSRA